MNKCFTLMKNCQFCQKKDQSQNRQSKNFWKMIFELFWTPHLCVQFYYMTASTSQQDYLKKLLGRHEGKGKKAENYLRSAEAGYETKIKMGKYEIKQGEEFPHRKARTISKMHAQNLKDNRRSLQKNLQLIDSRIGQITQPDHLNKKIDDKERRKFVSQMAKARKQLDKKREQKIQEELKKMKEQKEKEEEDRKKKSDQDRERRKQSLMKRAQSMQIKRKHQFDQFQNENKILKEKMHEKTLSARMMEKFEQVEAMNLENKKRKLAEIRSLHKPLTKSDFELHLQKIDKLKSERSRVDENTSRYMTGNTSKFYKSSWYKKVTEAPMKFEHDMQQQELYQVKQMKDKLKKYGEYVRQNFRPEVSQKKAKDLANKNKSSPIPMVKFEQLRELGLKYLQYSKQHIDPNKKQNMEQEDEKSRIIKPKNYLEDIKKNSKGEKNAKQFINSIQKKKNLSESQKAQKILDYVGALQRKAKLKEQKDKLNHVMLDEQLDNLYMEAIAVKMSMLGKEEVQSQN